MFDRFKKDRAPANGVPAEGQPQSELHARRDELAARVAELTWDLGGLTYEMAIRDHFRLDVLVRRAAELQEADAQLGEVERLLASSYEGVGGTCRACGSPHSRGAVFCWHCGTQLVEHAPSIAAAGGPLPAAAPLTAPGAAPPQGSAEGQPTAVVTPVPAGDATVFGIPPAPVSDDTIVGGGQGGGRP